jgi:hypothetical protein
MHIFSVPHLLIGPLATCLQGLAWWMGGDECVTAIANEVGAPCSAERLAYFEVVLWLEKLQ